jgi:hypothetical protein
MPPASMLVLQLVVSLFVLGIGAPENGVETAVEGNLHNGEKDLPPSDSMDIFVRKASALFLPSC